MVLEHYAQVTSRILDEATVSFDREELMAVVESSRFLAAGEVNG